MGLGAHKRVRHANKHASPIPRIRIAPAPPAVTHSNQHFVRISHNAPGRNLLQLSDKPNTTILSFTGRII
mgnify:CR=1 FL=1